MVKYYLTGISLSIIGILLARLLPKYLPEPQQRIISYLGGTALAFAGLAIIAFGIKKKHGGEKT